MAKVATPATAATVVVPPSVAPLGFTPNPSVTFPVKPGTVLLNGSRAATTIGGEIATFSVPSVGIWMNASCVAAPGVTLKLPLLAVVAPAALASNR